ncbi:ribbon-helix-helix protein, CopG family [Candidatus Saccharibacteria bacterium]|nr:ribbon-helix-helix protein, CopG family [Candidatus Saccharibacteria bacterium]
MEKRKTKTSSAVKNRYNQKTYTAVTAMLHKDLAQAFKERCKETGTSQSQVVKEAVERFLAK